MGEKAKIVARLHRIEGQVRGLARMVEEDEGCEKILTQLLAVRAALDQAGLKVIERYMELCLPDKITDDDLQKSRQDLQRALELLMRMR